MIYNAYLSTITAILVCVLGVSYNTSVFFMFVCECGLHMTHSLLSLMQMEIEPCLAIDFNIKDILTWRNFLIF